MLRIKYNLYRAAYIIFLKINQKRFQCWCLTKVKIQYLFLCLFWLGKQYLLQRPIFFFVWIAKKYMYISLYNHFVFILFYIDILYPPSKTISIIYELCCMIIYAPAYFTLADTMTSYRIRSIVTRVQHHSISSRIAKSPKCPAHRDNCPLHAHNDVADNVSLTESPRFHASQYHVISASKIWTD